MIRGDWKWYQPTVPCNLSGSFKQYSHLRLGKNSFDIYGLSFKHCLESHCVAVSLALWLCQGFCLLPSSYRSVFRTHMKYVSKAEKKSELLWNRGSQRLMLIEIRRQICHALFYCSVYFVSIEILHNKKIKKKAREMETCTQCLVIWGVTIISNAGMDSRPCSC